MFGMQHANHFVFSQSPAKFVGADRGSYPNGLTCYASLDQKKSPGPRTATTASFADRIYNGQLHAPLAGYTA